MLVPIQEEPMSEKVLIVDDDRLVRSSVRGFLEDQGYEPAESANGVAALEAFDRDRPDLLLLDLRMPGMDGLETLREVRRRSTDVPVIIISGAGQSEDVVQALRLGAWEYLFKPIRDLNMIDHAVRSCLERARLTRENHAYRTRLEEMVAQRTSELEAANASLQRKTVALEEVLATCRDDADRRVARAVGRIGQFCAPLLAELRRAAPASCAALADQIDRAIGDAASDGVERMADELSALSPAELRVCEMIRRGMASKEIAAATRLSLDTIETHRRNIRRKLRITNGSVNLSTFLQKR
jgi:DNA-binding NarL/FixJ family response regulator